MTTWSGLLLDPSTRTITTVTIPATWEAIAPAIDATTFDVARVDPDDRHSAFVDDNGLGNAKAFTAWLGYPQPLAGKILVLGNDPATGESCSCTWTAEEVREMVGFGDAFIRSGDRLVLVTDNGLMETD